MKELLLVALGGALGSSARYLLSGFVLHHTVQHKFPYGTFAVNVLGCLLAGIIAGLAEKHQIISYEIRLFLLVGILGGFTTFSAFGVETIYLIKRGEFMIASVYVLSSLACSLLAVYFTFSAIALKR